EQIGRNRRNLAEGEGFEPPEPLPVQWFSRPPPSTARPSLRVEIAPQSVRFVDRRPSCVPSVTACVTNTTTRDDTERAARRNCSAHSSPRVPYVATTAVTWPPQAAGRRLARLRAA